ncbi:MAG: hypothetical protein JSS66_02170 [Armatimonadetes bacterium]|nr:hypothetical protein [Armatimonadota bacterium]
MNEWNELVTLLAGFLATAFAILRLAVAQNRGVMDRFVSFLEGAVQRQDHTIDGLREAVERLNDGVRENTLLVRQMSEWLQVGRSS